MPRIPSVTYAGGELGPGLHGRVDLEKYATGLELAENFLISAEGGVIKRPGTGFVGYAKNGTATDVRFIEWQVAFDDPYVLEVGPAYIRLIRFGAYVKDGSGNFIEIATPYTEEDLRGLKFYYANDIIYITSPNNNTQIIRRLGASSFVISGFDYGDTFNLPRPQGIVGEKETKPTGSGTVYQPYEENIYYQVSALYTNGSESLPTNPVVVYIDLAGRQYTSVIKWNPPDTTGTDLVVDRYVVYKKQSGMFGFVSYVDNTPVDGVLEYRDRNFTPSYDKVPKRFFNPGTEFKQGWPSVGEFYKQRMIFAGTPGIPEGMWFTQPSLFGDFSTSIPTQDDDGISLVLASGTRQNINHIVPMKDLIVFTDTTEWIIKSDGPAFTPNTVFPDPQSYYGAAKNIRPLKINERVLFVEGKTGTVRDLGYRQEADRLVGEDLNRLSRHLFLDNEVLSWTYASYPYNLVLCGMSNGQLNHMTYDRDNEIWGWSHSKFDGVVWEVASVAELNQTAGYIAIDRFIGGQLRRCIERIDFETKKDLFDSYYVECGLSYKDARDVANLQVQGGVIVFGGLAPFPPGTEVELVTPLTIPVSQTEDARLRGYFTVGVSGGNNTLTPSRGFDLSPFENKFCRFAELYRTATMISGLDHLNGETVAILADGIPQAQRQVVNGTINLTTPAGRVHVGLPYKARLKTLDLDIQQEFATFEDKNISDVYIHLKDSYGLFVGRKGEELHPIKDPKWEIGRSKTSPLTGVFEVPADGEWARTVGVEVLADSPLPCQILNITPDVSYGRKG